MLTRSTEKITFETTASGGHAGRCQPVRHVSPSRRMTMVSVLDFTVGDLYLRKVHWYSANCWTCEADERG